MAEDETKATTEGQDAPEPTPAIPPDHDRVAVPSIKATGEPDQTPDFEVIVDEAADRPVDEPAEVDEAIDEDPDA